MTTERFQQYIKEWKEANAKVELSFDCISVEEIYRSNNVNLNRSYYQCIVMPENSKTGKLCNLLYSSIDLLEIDNNGDITSATSIDYMIIE